MFVTIFLSALLKRMYRVFLMLSRDKKTNQEINHYRNKQYVEKSLFERYGNSFELKLDFVFRSEVAIKFHFRTCHLMSKRNLSSVM